MWTESCPIPLRLREAVNFRLFVSLYFDARAIASITQRARRMI